MPSPFPGMDPFLEGHLWPDLNHALASKIRQILAPPPALNAADAAWAQDLVT